MVKVFAEDAQAGFEVAALVFGPQRRRITGRDRVDFPPPQRLVNVVTALEQLVERLQGGGGDQENHMKKNRYKPKRWKKK